MFSHSMKMKGRVYMEWRDYPLFWNVTPRSLIFSPLTDSLTNLLTNTSLQPGQKEDKPYHNSDDFHKIWQSFSLVILKR